MKTRIVLYCFCCLVLTCRTIGARAQQQPYYTQYILNTFIINPAVAGLENYWDVKTSYRNQWLGINGSPVTAYLTFQGPFKKSDYDRETPTTVHMPGESSGPGGKQFWMEYTAPPAHAGFGLTVMDDKTGPLNRYAAYGTLAYHIPLEVKTSLSVGVSAGIQEISVDVSQLNFGGMTPTIDPAVSGNGELNKIKPDFNAGIWLNSARFFLGLSAQQIVAQPLEYGDQEIVADTLKLITGKLVPHLFLNAGYKLALNEDITFLPSVMVKYVDPLPVSFDLNAKVQYLDLFWVGASYRYKEGYAGMIGLNINNTFTFSYSYDYTTTLLNTVSSGTHEVVLGFILGRHQNDSGPRSRR
jgi:type IX secretion system PorP/SprF family membrane protein